MGNRNEPDDWQMPAAKLTFAAMIGGLCIALLIAAGLGWL